MAERSSTVEIIISNSVNKPIYEQICTQIKNQIISGALPEDEALPSIRSLAKDLRISVITTKRAYDELEQEGFIYTIAGKGCFVAKRNTEMIREENLKKIEGLLEEVRMLARSCGISGDELADMLRLLTEENAEDNTHGGTK